MPQTLFVSTPSNHAQNASSSRNVAAQNQGLNNVSVATTAAYVYSFPHQNDALRDFDFGAYKVSTSLHAAVHYGREAQPVPAVRVPLAPFKRGVF